MKRVRLWLVCTCIAICLSMAPMAYAAALGDLDCDGSINVTDVQLSILLVLNIPLHPTLDTNGDAIPDACAVSPTIVECGDGTVLSETKNTCVVSQQALDAAYSSGVASVSGMGFCGWATVWKPALNLCESTLPVVNLSGVNVAGSLLKYASLAGVDLTGADLSNVNLQGGNLSAADLTDATLWGVFAISLLGDCPAKLPAEWSCVTQPSGTRALAGPGANLFGANLSGTQLSGINLSGANLGKANLSGANLTGTHLTGANLAGANLTGANIEDALVCTLDADCDDSDPCTADTCQSGGCVSEPMGNCCSNDDCDDGQPCTLNTCEQNQCVTAPITTGCCIGGSCQAVFDTPQSTFTLPAVSGEGIYYPDVQASFPDVQWDTLDRLYIPAGQYKYITLNNLPNRSKDKPLIITNKGGQVWVGALGHYYLFGIGGGSGWILTGRWDPVGKTGHHSLAGHAGNHYANTAGTYGIIIDDAFVKDGLTGLGVGGGATNFEVEFMEITRVGFAGMSIKSDGYPDAHMYDVKVHDMYIHDTGSEGFYFGSTQTQPQHRIMGLQLYNNRVLRAGTELIQIGQVGGDTRIHHNVFMLGALDWKDPFQGYQDNASQLASRQGSVEIDHNIFIGGADSMLNFHPQEVEGDVHQAGDRVHVHDNYYSHGRHLGTFVGSNSDGKTVYRFENNVYREMVFSYDELYPGKAPHNEHFRVNHNQINTVEIIGNTWDGPTAIASNLPNVITEGNVNGPSDPVAFHDAGFEPDFDFFRVEMWGAKSGIQQNAPIDYEPGDYVVHKGLFYRCIATESHTNRPPQDHPDTWELLPSLPDDVRLAPGSPHGAVGLLDTVP